MVTRIGGLASGMDIDSLVEKLMQAERAPLNKLEQQKQIYEWQRDAYRSVNTKLQTLDTYIADNLILKSFNTKTATTSNSAFVTATATGSASGTLTIEGVSQLATAARSVGQQVNATGSTSLSDLFANSGVTVTESFIELRAIQKDGTLASKATKIEFTTDMTVDQFVSKINSSNAGVSAVFENGRLSITAKNTGDVKGGAEVVVDSGNTVFDAFKMPDSTNLASGGTNAIFKVNGIATERSTNTFAISGYNITLKDTFNDIQTIAEKYTAAKTELDLATTNKTNKQDILNAALAAYYGEEATTLSYTTAHNSAYTTAFGNTLSLSQQETYSKLGSSFWKGLSQEEITFMDQLTSGQSATDIRTAIDSSSLSVESKSKLKGLSDEKLLVVSNLSEAEMKDYQLHANYQTYGTKLKDFDEATRNALASFSYNSNDDLQTIHQNIDSNLNVSEDVKKVLKSLSKENLTNLLATDTATLAIYQEKAQADDLKTKYNSLGDSFYNELTSEEIDTISEIDFTQEDAITNISDENLKSKLQNLSESQIKALDSLSVENLSNFKNLASQNIYRKEYAKANTEYQAAESRLTNAQNTLESSKADAEKAGILDANGNIDETAVNNAPTSQAITLTSTTNVDEIITKIKDFVSTYNGLVKELNDLTKESKYRDYQPLTAAQKEEMEEKEIELWEEKAKSGLLRSDSILRSGLTSMRSIVYESNPAVSNPKYNTLYSIGITTSKNYNDGGTLEIDEAKLRAALEEDPDAVTTLFTNPNGNEKDTMLIDGVEKEVDTRGYLQKLRDSMSELKQDIEKKAGRSTMSETQYSLGNTLKDINNRIDSWKDKLENIESRYWRQFTAMETAINKANQQSSLFMQQ